MARLFSLLTLCTNLLFGLLLRIKSSISGKFLIYKFSVRVRNAAAILSSYDRQMATYLSIVRRPFTFATRCNIWLAPAPQSRRR